MPQAIPAAIGLGGSIFSGISGKSAAKKQEKLAREQMAMIQPLIQAQVEGSKFALDQSKPFLKGAGQAAQDLQGFWRPLAFGDRSAIDQFLSPERRAINQGYQNQANYLARFAPPGSRVSALARANNQRQGQLSELVFGARKEGANQLGNLAQLLGSLGTSTLSSGLGGGGNAMQLLAGQQNRAFQTSRDAASSLGGLGKSLGSFVSSLFDDMGWGKKGDSSGGMKTEVEPY